MAVARHWSRSARAAPAELPDLLASDLDVPARGSAHAPSRRGGSKILPG